MSEVIVGRNYKSYHNWSSPLEGKMVSVEPVTTRYGERYRITVFGRDEISAIIPRWLGLVIAEKVDPGERIKIERKGDGQNARYEVRKL